MVSDAELLHHTAHIGSNPSLGDFSVFNAGGDHVLHLDIVAGRFDALKLALVGSPKRDAHRDHVSLGNGVLDGPREASIPQAAQLFAPVSSVVASLLLPTLSTPRLMSMIVS